MKTIAAISVVLVLAGCQSTTSVVDGSGFQMLHPSPATRKFIISNDLDFAREVVAHNTMCEKQPGCREGK